MLSVRRRRIRLGMAGLACALVGIHCAALIDLEQPSDRRGVDSSAADASTDSPATNADGSMPVDDASTLATLLDPNWGGGGVLALGSVGTFLPFDTLDGGIVYTLLDGGFPPVLELLDPSGNDAGSVPFPPETTPATERIVSVLVPLSTTELGAGGGGTVGSPPFGETFRWLYRLSATGGKISVADAGEEYAANERLIPGTLVDVAVGGGSFGPYSLFNGPSPDIASTVDDVTTDPGKALGLTVLPTPDPGASVTLLALIHYASDAGLELVPYEISSDGGVSERRDDGGMSASIAGLASAGFAQNDAGGAIVGTTPDGGVAVGTADRRGAHMTFVTVGRTDVTINSATTNGDRVAAGGCVGSLSSIHPWLAVFTDGGVDPSFNGGAVLEGNDFAGYCVTLVRYDPHGRLLLLLAQFVDATQTAIVRLR